MRFFFFSLLALNAVFLLYNALSKEPEFRADEINRDLPQLVLLNEQGKAATKAKTATSLNESTETADSSDEQSSPIDLGEWLAKLTGEEQAEAPSTNLTPAAQCYTAGPFQDSDRLQQATNFLSGLAIDYEQRSSIEKQYIGMLVYLPSHESRKAVVNVAEELVSKGVKDYMLLNEPGKSHALSLGVFGLQKNAQKRVEALAKLNYQALTEARYKKKTIEWLDYQIKGQIEQINLAEQQMKDLNVSQIERNCKS